MNTNNKVMEEMIEVTQEYFYKVIHELNVHYSAHKEHGEWRLNGYSLIAKTTPGYSNQYLNGVRQQKRYFVIPAYSPTLLAPDNGQAAFVEDNQVFAPCG